jgi:hypothetical protein
MKKKIKNWNTFWQLKYGRWTYQPTDQDTTGMCGEKVVLEQRWGHIPKINSQKYGLWEATKSSRLWLHGEWSGTIHGFMMLITAVQVKLVLIKKKTFKLLTPVRKGGLFTVLRVACVGRRVMIPSKKYTRRLASWPCDIRDCRNWYILD